VTLAALACTATFRQTFAVTGVRQYPSIVVLPHAGCWRLDLTSGTAKGTLLVLGVDA
jgi:hypothetical protein